MKKLLGKELKDNVSGFSGKCTAYIVYIHGEDMVEITERTYAGKPAVMWFNISRVELEKPVKKQKLVIKKAPAKKKAVKGVSKSKTVFKDHIKK